MNTIQYFVELRNCFHIISFFAMQIGNNAGIGQKIGFIKAQDNDGTSPNNQIKYSLSEDQSSERATKYFGIDEVTGEIQVLEDLKRELFENYLLSVVATDQGEPPISASMTIVVQVKSSESNSYSNLH